MEKIVVDVERYRGPIRRWWVSLLLGLLFLVMGVIVFFFPGQTFFALAILFGLSIMFSGILEIFVGFSMGPQSGRGWVIAMGSIEFFLGLLLVSLPQISMWMMPILLGFWLLFRGFSLVGISSDMMAYGIKGQGWVVAVSILLIMTAFLIIFHPIFGMGAIVILLGVGLILMGVDMIIFGMFLKGLNKELE